MVCDIIIAHSWRENTIEIKGIENFLMWERNSVHSLSGLNL